MTIVVNSAANQTQSASGTTVSLAAAISRADRAKGPVAITFSPAVFATHRTLTLTDGDMTIGNPFGLISITGPAAGITIVMNFNSSAQNLIIRTGSVEFVGVDIDCRRCAVCRWNDQQRNFDNYPLERDRPGYAFQLGDAGGGR